MLIAGPNSSGAPGTGVAWDESVRAVSIGDLRYFPGVGPFGVPQAVADRASIHKSLAAEQFGMCLDNLLQRMRDAYVNRPLEPSLDHVRAIFLRLNDIADLPAIDAVWRQRFASDIQGPARTIQVGEIRGGAKVELDAVCSDLWRQVFRATLAFASTPNEYLSTTAALSYSDAGWLAALTGQYPIAVMNEEEVNNANSSLLLDAGAGVLMFGRWDQDANASAGAWSAHTNHAKARPAAAVVAWPQWFLFDATTNPQTFTVNLSGWDIAGALLEYLVIGVGGGAGAPAKYPTLATLVDNGGGSVTFTLPVGATLHDGQSWFHFRVRGPSGWSQPAKVHAWWYTDDWGIAA